MGSRIAERHVAGSRLALLVLVVAATCAPLSAPAGQSVSQSLRVDTGTWFPIGPTTILNTSPSNGGSSSGRATVIAANPTMPQEVWLGTATGGVWHTTNAQSTDPSWIPVDGLQFPDNLAGPTGPVAPGAMAMSIGALAVDGCTPLGCARVWIGTGENAIRRDTYYGAGLFLLTLKGLRQVADFRYGSVVRIALAPHVPGTTTDKLYVAVSSGLTAAGNEEAVTAPAPAEGYGIYKTQNAGGTFLKLPIPGVSRSLPSDIAIDERNPSGDTMLVGFMARDRFDSTQVRGILQGTAGGELSTDWCSMNDNAPLVERCVASSGLPPGNSVVQNPPIEGADEILGQATIRFSPNASGRVYAMFGTCGEVAGAGCRPVIYRSDFGVVWQRLFLSNPSFPSLAYGRYTHALTVAPGDPLAENILLGGIELQSCPGVGGGCTTLGIVPKQGTYSDHHDVLFPDAANPQLVYDVNDGGFFFSVDGGTTWTGTNTTLTTSQLSSIAVYRQSILGGLQDHGMAYFDGTRVWTNLPSFSDGGNAVVYSYGDPPTPVWIFSEHRDLPSRAVGDPTAGAGAQSLAQFMPPTAQDQAAHNVFTRPQLAFFPPIALNTANHDIYFATTQVYKSTDTGDVRGNAWTTLSPVLAAPTGTVFDTLATDNVITALGVGTDGVVYAGTYTGEVWVGLPGGCPTSACWSKVGDFKNPISSLLVNPKNSDIVFVALSGFGASSHVFYSINRGTFWNALNAGLLDTPANVIRYDASGNLWLGTDIGIYEFLGGSWLRSQTLPFVPVTDIGAWRESDGSERLYAATHGRGVWALTQATVTTFEGRVGGNLTDLVVNGYGFPSNGSSSVCLLRLIQQSGNVCTSGFTDAIGGSIRVDESGQLYTTNLPAWDKMPMVFACSSSTCLSGVPIQKCNQDAQGHPDPLSTVEVRCFASGTGIGRLNGAVTLGNPPSTGLGLDPPKDAPAVTKPARWKFEVVVSRTTATGASLLCRAPVNVVEGAADEEMAIAATAAVNASHACRAKGVKALTHFPSTASDEPVASPPTVSVQAPGHGSQLFVTFRGAPGAATGLVFDIFGLGNATLRQSAIMRTVVETRPAGAVGGSVRLIESSDVGTCQRDVPTTAGMSASAVATAIATAFTSVTAPGPRECIARGNARDVRAQGAALITSMARRLSIVSFDPGIGFASAPTPIEVVCAEDDQGDADADHEGEGEGEDEGDEGRDHDRRRNPRGECRDGGRLFPPGGP